MDRPTIESIEEVAEFVWLESGTKDESLKETAATICNWTNEQIPHAGLPTYDELIAVCNMMRDVLVEVSKDYCS